MQAIQWRSLGPNPPRSVICRERNRDFWANIFHLVTRVKGVKPGDEVATFIMWWSVVNPAFGKQFATNTGVIDLIKHSYLFKAIIAAMSCSFSAWLVPKYCHACKQECGNYYLTTKRSFHLEKISSCRRDTAQNANFVIILWRRVIWPLRTRQFSRFTSPPMQNHGFFRNCWNPSSAERIVQCSLAKRIVHCYHR